MPTPPHASPLRPRLTFAALALATVAALAGLTTLTACGGDGGTGTDSEALHAQRGGLWVAERINGQPLPWVLFEADNHRIVAARLVLYPSIRRGWWEQCEEVQDPTLGTRRQLVDREIGWTTAGSALEIVWLGSGANAGTRDAGTVSGTSATVARTLGYEATYTFRQVATDPRDPPSLCGTVE